LFGEHALRINVTIEKEAIATTQKYRKLVVIIPRNIPNNITRSSKC
jgi:hypothetical protein